MKKPELLFVDPSVLDAAAIVGGVRPEVEAVALVSEVPAAHQMAAHLRFCRDLDAVHVIAHGGPGCVKFAGGDWSAATLERDAGDLAAIGASLREGGQLSLWSCDVGSSAVGEAFVARLTEKIGADVAAANSPVGASASGGRWELASPRARAPLTALATASYPGVLAAVELMVTGDLPLGDTSKPVPFFIVDTSTNAVVGKVVLPDAVREHYPCP